MTGLLAEAAATGGAAALRHVDHLHTYPDRPLPAVHTAPATLIHASAAVLRSKGLKDTFPPTVAVYSCNPTRI